MAETSSFEQVIKRDRAARESKQWRGNLLEYLEVVKANPLMTKLSHARIYDMIITQPVVYRFGEIAVPTLLMIGQKDTTAIAKDFAPPELRPMLGNYPELGKAAAKAIPGAKLVEFPEFGHAPQMTDPEGFDKALIAGISKP